MSSASAAPVAGGEPSVFSRMLTGEVPADFVLQTQNVFVVRDIAPQAPVHLLVVPRTEAYRDVTEVAEHEPRLLAEMVEVAHTAAVQAGSPDFRLVFNTGVGAGQTVFHVHAHVLGGDLDERGFAGGGVERGDAAERGGRHLAAGDGSVG